MSVINKMLRDLDHRHASDAGAPTPTEGADVRQGTVSLAKGLDQKLHRPTSTRVRWVVLGSTLSIAMLTAAAWLWQEGYFPYASSTVAVLPAPQAAPIAVAVTPAPAPASNPEPSAEAVPPPVSEDVPIASSKNMELRMDSTLSLRRLLETELAPAAAVVKTPLPEKPAPKVAQPVPGNAGSQAAAVNSTGADTVQAAQRQQQQAAKDAIAHAQSLWNAGSREAAIELMQEVVASSERAAAVGGTPANTVQLVAQVRELTRMQLAESRPGPVLDLLTRLEPKLDNQPDLWAVRANAAQRLGRHQDSVHAYMMALQVRPSEQRWLLGAAVSLAALGQTASSAEMADKARAVGTISKDVQAYLRQMGVPTKD